MGLFGGSSSKSNQGSFSGFNSPIMGYNFLSNVGLKPFNVTELSSLIPRTSSLFGFGPSGGGGSIGGIPTPAPAAPTGPQTYTANDLMQLLEGDKASNKIGKFLTAAGLSGTGFTIDDAMKAISATNPGYMKVQGAIGQLAQMEKLKQQADTNRFAQVGTPAASGGAAAPSNPFGFGGQGGMPSYDALVSSYKQAADPTLRSAERSLDARVTGAGLQDSGAGVFGAERELGDLRRSIDADAQNRATGAYMNLLGLQQQDLARMDNFQLQGLQTFLDAVGGQQGMLSGLGQVSRSYGKSKSKSSEGIMSGLGNLAGGIGGFFGGGAA